MNSIKISTESQLTLLRSINPLLGKYIIPRDLLLHMYYYLQDDNFGKYGFIIILLDPVIDHIGELEDAVNIYPFKVQFLGEAERQDIEDSDCDIVKEREWYIAKMIIEGMDSHVYIFYSMLRNMIYKRNLEPKI